MTKIENLLLGFGSWLRSYEQTSWYPIVLNKIVGIIERITNVIILTEDEASILIWE